MRHAIDDTACDLPHEVALFPVGVAEAQRIEHTDDVGAHAVDVAHDATNAGGGALERQ